MSQQRSVIRKRSIVLVNKKTSVSLEDEFWGALNEIARKRALTVNSLVNEIAARNKKKNLSSALRVFALVHFRYDGSSVQAAE